MKQYEAVIKVMQENGGYATLGFLNQMVLKVKGCGWKTKTPFASIRRIVQDNRFFFKIRPGLWALKEYRDKLPSHILPEKESSKEKKTEYSHTYYQGLLVEIGNMRKFGTFVPMQDKNKSYLDKKLGDFTTITSMYNFSYDNIIRIAKTIDVSWFNERQMPFGLFEVEHSTPIQNSLLKFVELQDFNADFYIVANEVRRREYQTKLSLNAFRPIQKRLVFWSYDDVAELHSRMNEVLSVESKLGL